MSTAEERTKRGLTIRLKLTLWYGCLFVLAGVILIAANYYMVRDSLTIAPEKARAAVAEEFGIPPEALEFRHLPGVDPGQMQRYVTINGIPLPVLIDRAQRELRQEALRQLWTRSLIALAIMAVVVFGLSWLVAGRMLRPLHAITSAARRLSGSTLHERINLHGPRDELKELADTFDSMLGRLDTAFTAQREFVANASHELRTPLTIIRTEVDVALSDPDVSPEELQEMGAAITEAVDRSEGLIDGLLVLASADADGRPAMTDLDLAEIAADEVDLSSAEADALGLAARTRSPARPRPGRAGAARATGGQPRRELHPPQPAQRLVQRQDPHRRRQGRADGGQQRPHRCRPRSWSGCSNASIGPTGRAAARPEGSVWDCRS